MFVNILYVHKYTLGGSGFRKKVGRMVGKIY